MVKMKKLAYPILSITLLMACRLVTPATPPPPVDAALDTEFTLAPDQIVTIASTGLTIKLISVPGDQRCPFELECAVSGPVSVSLSVQMDDGEPVNLDLQTFTDNNGRAPGMEFEGIKDRTTYEGYLIRVAGVLPYPQKSMSEVKDSEYRVTLVVSKK
jgi:hypothetical protein